MLQSSPEHSSCSSCTTLAPLAASATSATALPRLHPIAAILDSGLIRSSSGHHLICISFRGQSNVIGPNRVCNPSLGQLSSLAIPIHKLIISCPAWALAAASAACMPALLRSPASFMLPLLPAANGWSTASANSEMRQWQLPSQLHPGKHQLPNLFSRPLLMRRIQRGRCLFLSPSQISLDSSRYPGHQHRCYCLQLSTLAAELPFTTTTQASRAVAIRSRGACTIRVPGNRGVGHRSDAAVIQQLRTFFRMQGTPHRFCSMSQKDWRRRFGTTASHASHHLSLSWGSHRQKARQNTTTIR